jgi:hypothetical protein
VTRLRRIPYVDQLLAELERIWQAVVDVMVRSQIENLDPPSNFIGFPEYAWAPSDDALQSDRMVVLSKVREFRTRFELLFPHPTPEVRERHDEALEHLERWLDRGESDHSTPSTIPAAVEAANASVAVLAAAEALLRAEDFSTRLVVDTNGVLDNPDLGQFTPQLSGLYVAHVLPVVLRELDDHKRGGRTDSLRESAKKADGLAERPAQQRGRVGGREGCRRCLGRV